MNDDQAKCLSAGCWHRDLMFIETRQIEGHPVEFYVCTFCLKSYTKSGSDVEKFL